MATKRIHNPKTKTYYRIRQKNTQNGNKGQIMGKYKSDAEVKIYMKKSIGDVIRKLSNE